MAIIKSNSALIAFDGAATYDSTSYNFLDYIQSFKLTTTTKRTNNKFLSKSDSIKKQFTKPEVLLELSYFQTNNFNNEKLFGFSKIYNAADKVSFASKLISFPLIENSSVLNAPFSNKIAYALFSELNTDIIDIFSSINDYGLVPYPINYKAINGIISMSLGNLFLNSYSFSYRINELPIVNCSFLCSDLLISNLTVDTEIVIPYAPPGYRYGVQSWTLYDYIYLTKKQFSDFKQKTSESKEYLVLLMQDLVFQTNFSNTASPGPNIDNFLNGLIQSLDISIDFNRSEFYFFNSSNGVSSRQIVPPLKLKLTINGISNKFTTNLLDYFFIQDSKFSCSILIGNEGVNKNLNRLLFDDLCMENFNYSIDINGNLIYSIECYCDITSEKGLRILELGVYDPTLNPILSSDGYNILTKDLFYAFAS